MVKAKDVAQRMGISISTIYKAFNGASDINDETRAAILETAAEMGYVNRGQRVVSNKRACVFISRMEAPHVTYYLYEVMIAFKQTAAKYGYEVVIRDVEDNRNCSYDQVMRQHCFEGSLMLGLTEASDFYAELKNVTYPTVLVDNYIENPYVSCICADNLSGMDLTVGHLVDLGHTRIGFINGEANSLSSRERFAGYLNAMTLRGLSYDPNLVRNGDYSEYSGSEMAEELLEQKVTAIACASDLMAIGAIRRLQKKGIAVPGDVSVTGFDDIRLSSYVTPMLTTARVNIKDIGYRAFLCLKDLIENRNTTRVIHPARLMVRDSTAPCGG